MRTTLKSLVPALAASLTLAACGSSSSGTGSSSSSSSTPPASTPGSASATAVKTTSNATLGSTVLTDVHGMTLYSLSGESAGKFICASTSCTQVWHPLSATGSGTPSGVASLGTVTRPDGTLQVTYKGMPLYTFAQDQQPGEAKGQGLKDVGTWSAATVASAGAPATSTGSSSSTPTQTGRSGY
jgi:predicted lipoprotein with Yx(FWY)xxD motif